MRAPQLPCLPAWHPRTLGSSRQSLAPHCSRALPVPGTWTAGVGGRDVSATGLFPFHHRRQPLPATTAGPFVAIGIPRPRITMTNSHRRRQIQGRRQPRAQGGGAGWKSYRQHTDTHCQFPPRVLTPQRPVSRGVWGQGPGQPEGSLHHSHTTTPLFTGTERNPRPAGLARAGVRLHKGLARRDQAGLVRFVEPGGRWVMFRVSSKCSARLPLVLSPEDGPVPLALLPPVAQSQTHSSVHFNTPGTA